MLSPRLTNCPECANIPSLLKKIDCKLAELGNNLYNNISYMLNKPIPAGDITQLITYRRILLYKFSNPNYAHKYSVDMIASRVIRLTAGCVSRCNTPEPCVEVPCDITIVPNNPITTTTSTSSTTTTTTTTIVPTTTSTSTSSSSTTTTTSSSSTSTSTSTSSSSTTTTTTTLEPTTTTTTTVGIICNFYTLNNLDDFDSTYSYLDCEGLLVEDVFIDAFGTANICAQADSVNFNSEIIDEGICPTTTTTTTTV
jgi:hypothetical protein